LGGYMAAKLGDRVKSFGMIGSARLTGQRTMVEGLINWKRLDSPEEVIAAHRHNLGVVMLSDISKVDDLALHLQRNNAPTARVKSHRFVRRLTLPEVMMEVSAPVCVFWGTKDQYYPYFVSAYDEQITARNIKMGVDTIEGAGHWAIYECADEMNKKLQAFFESHE
ncbi:MAG: alpha/beta hydrolase, partial [Proteobacteria bacterium]|nr:alpha/beta hydrolase [Pseudomonadota bacterium]